MIEILLTVIPSICWLMFRCYQLLTTPADRLARQLNVDIPHTPSVCVDQLGASHVVLHWDIEISPDENIFYVVLLNGKDAGTLAQTSVKLCNLEHDKLYRIQVLAVNAISNFRSQSAAVYVHTQKPGKKSKLPFPVAKKVELPALRQDAKATNYSLDLSSDHVVKLTDKQVLAEYLYVFQNEVAKVTSDIDVLAEHQKQEEGKLKAELESYKKELDEGSESRARKDLDVKHLEKKKDLLTFEKLKITKQLKNYESLRVLHVNNIAELKAKVGKLREKRQHVLNLLKNEENKVTNEMDAINGDICHIREDITSLEQSVKELSNERKELSVMLQNLKPLVYQFVTPPVLLNLESPDGSLASLVAAAEIFTRESSLTKLGNEVLKKIYSYKPTWEGDLSKEIEALASLELSWRNTFKTAIRRFVQLQNTVETSRAAQDATYEPQTVTEYQASVEFGGFGNAIGKARKKGYVFVDEGSASPSPPPEQESWRATYREIYEETDSAGMSVNNSASLSNVNMAPNLSNVSQNIGNVSQNVSSLSQNIVNTSQSAIGMSQNVSLNMNLSMNVDIAQELAGYPQTYGSPNGVYETDSGVDNLLSYGYKQENYGTLQNNLENYGEGKLANFEYPYQDNYSQNYENYDQNHGQTYDQNYDQKYDQNYDQKFENYDQKYDQNYVNSSLNTNLSNLAYTDSYPVLNQPLANATSPVLFRPEIDQQLQQTSMTQSISQPQLIPLASMQQYAQNIRQSFPYEEVYSMRSPTPDSYLQQMQQAQQAQQAQQVQQVQPNLWNQSQNNFLESRTFSGLSLSPSSANMELHPLQNIASNSMVPQVPVQDSSLLNSLLLSTSTSQIGSSSIWLDKPMTSSYSHNRAVSSTSQLWRNDRPEGSPNLGLGSEFLPFLKDDKVNTP